MQIHFGRVYHKHVKFSHLSEIEFPPFKKAEHAISTYINTI